ncbi:PhrC/PhrF family phosphatase-inhibitory pheromone [Bacillus vallismortis]|nr:PhrC/PhrF family phosphatase-inhibitory pheromone [Bacillus vallismortis]MEC1651545.1 PhrC/PhrF family phosphatase-inhibitory pheromone [Bacillus vallismortis]
MKWKYKLLLACLAVSAIFITVEVSNSSTEHFDVAQRAMI